MSKGGIEGSERDIWDPEETYEFSRLEGWLEKKGEKGVFLKGKKKRRFFRTFVDDGIPILFYYETDNPDDEPKGSIDFRSGTLFLQSSENLLLVLAVELDDKEEKSFRLITLNRKGSCHLCASSSEKRQVWVTFLRKYIEVCSLLVCSDVTRWRIKKS